MAAERYLSRRIPDLRVGNNIDKIDKKPVPSIYTSLLGRKTRRQVFSRCGLVHLRCLLDSSRTNITSATDNNIKKKMR